MGNDSSKRAAASNRQTTGGTTTSTTTTAASRAAETLQNVIKPSGHGLSSSALQRHLEQARKSKTLKLKGVGMKNVPPDIEELASELRTLDLSSNKILCLPPYIDHFGVLRQLYVQENRLSRLPDELGCLKRLEVLDASGNQIEMIPDSLVGCGTLSTLKLASNRLATFPLVIAHLPRLELLDLAGNSIRALPDEISSLRANELSLQRNQLSSLNAPSLVKCDRLRTLRVDENCLPKEAFTKELFEQSQLSLITFEGNLFQEKDFQALPGYSQYEQRFTATKRRLF